MHQYQQDVTAQLPQLPPDSEPSSLPDSLKDEPIPPSLNNGSSHVYIKRPERTYVFLLVFLATVVSLSLAFSLGARLASGGARAPPLLAKFTTSNPRVSAQLIAIIATILTASLNWARAGATLVLAQKRFQKLEPIFEIELFSAIKNGGVTWTWRRRPVAMLGTMSLVLLGGLLTSGFVALLSPFPIAIESEFSLADGELDLQSPSSSCESWANKTIYAMYCPSGSSPCRPQCGRNVRYSDTDFIYTTCPIQDQIWEGLSAAKSSMLRRFASVLPKEHQSNLVSAFTQLAGTRIIGSLAGTIPTGPAGLHYFSDSTFPNISDTTSSYNYTLQLQGLWTTATCAYVDNSESGIVAWPDEDGWLSYGVDCPGRWLSAKIPLRNTTKNHGLILASACIDSTSDNVTIHLRSFVDAEDYDSHVVPYPDQKILASRSVGLDSQQEEAAVKVSASSRSSGSLQSRQNNNQSNWAYAGIDAMKCTLMPRIGPVVATYHTDIAAFSIATPDSGYIPYSQMTPLALTRAWEATYETVTTFVEAQTMMSGNSVGSLIRSVGIAYAGLDGGTKNEEYPLLVADALKGIFEYQVSHQRLYFTAANPGPECRHPVTGRLIQRDIGWHTQTTTIIGLIPLWVISVASLGMVLWAMKLGGRVTVFDPTSAVSLIAATSVGEPGLFENHPERSDPVTGDPDDEIVRSTRVRYGNHEGGWGLRSY